MTDGSRWCAPDERRKRKKEKRKKKDKKEKKRKKKVKKEKKRKDKKKDKKKERRRKEVEEGSRKRSSADLTESELAEARDLWGDNYKLLSSAARDTGAVKRARKSEDKSLVEKLKDEMGHATGGGGSSGGGGQPRVGMERHEVDAMLPKESGRSGKLQSKQAKYHANRRFADNEDARSLGEVANLYGGEECPMLRRRAAAAASNAKVQALMAQMRAARGLPDPASAGS